MIIANIGTLVNTLVDTLVDTLVEQAGQLDMPTLVLLVQGHTPLIFASIGGHVQIVQMLLSHKADPLPSNGHVSPT